MVLGVFALAAEYDDAVVHILEIQPPEAVVGEINLPEGAAILVDRVQLPDEFLQLLVQGVLFGEMPVKAYLAVPLGDLAEFTSHEEEFFARMGPEKKEKQPQVGEFLPHIAGHLEEQRALAVYHFVVGHGQDKVFGEGVEQGKGEGVVMVFAEERLLAEIAQDVIHPAHVPFVAKAQTAPVQGL